MSVPNSQGPCREWYRKGIFLFKVTERNEWLEDIFHTPLSTLLGRLEVPNRTSVQSAEKSNRRGDGVVLGTRVRTDECRRVHTKEEGTVDWSQFDKRDGSYRKEEVNVVYNAVRSRSLEKPVLLVYQPILCGEIYHICRTLFLGLVCVPYGC